MGMRNGPQQKGQKSKQHELRYQVLTAAIMMIAAFWVVSPCSPEEID